MPDLTQLGLSQYGVWGIFGMLILRELRRGVNVLVQRQNGGPTDKAVLKEMQQVNMSLREHQARAEEILRDHNDNQKDLTTALNDLRIHCASQRAR